MTDLANNRYPCVHFILNAEGRPISFSSKTFPTEQEAYGDDISSQIPPGQQFDILQRIYRVDLSFAAAAAAAAADSGADASGGGGSCGDDVRHGTGPITGATATLLSSLLRPMTSQGARTSPLRQGNER